MYSENPSMGKLDFSSIENVLRENPNFKLKVFSSGGRVRVASIFDASKSPNSNEYYAEGANFDELIANLSNYIKKENKKGEVLYFTGAYPNSKIDAVVYVESSLKVSFDDKKKRFVFNQTKYNFHRTPKQIVEFCMKNGKDVVFHDIHNPGCYWKVWREHGSVVSQYLNDSNPDANKTCYDELIFEAEDLQTLFELVEVASEMYENV